MILIYDKYQNVLFMVELTCSSEKCVFFVSLCILRNHVKGLPRPEDVPPSSPALASGALMDSLSGLLSPQPLQISETLTGTTSATASLPSFSPKDTSPQPLIPSGYLSGTARGR